MSQTTTTTLQSYASARPSSTVLSPVVHISPQSPTQTPSSPSPSPSSNPQPSSQSNASSASAGQSQQHVHASVWKKVKACAFTNARMTVFGSLLAILSLAAAFQGLQYGKVSAQLAEQALRKDDWQAKATFRAWCRDEREAGRALTADCENILKSPLLPPPRTKRSILEALLGAIRRRGRATAQPMPQETTINYAYIGITIIMITLTGVLIRMRYPGLLREASLRASDLRDNVEVLPIFVRRHYESLDLSWSTQRLAKQHSPPPRRNKAETLHEFVPPDVSSIDFTFKPNSEDSRRRKPPRRRKRAPAAAQPALVSVQPKGYARSPLSNPPMVIKEGASSRTLPRRVIIENAPVVTARRSIRSRPDYSKDIIVPMNEASFRTRWWLPRPQIPEGDRRIDPEL
ncbi:hypothetical protein BDV95DRAFT_597975 [Massariosphaeria phaeospora]|uniref:Transmembrane protein n=1 Tax=Massariosphaeria phaeospora TaxID=100035 RepID=A0A7C8M264_9PLEO|nr:hypothetical protein BDV95DRAFT_597975 [Massariosphaeria phaeospora]